MSKHHSVLANPEKNCPDEILQQQVGVEVEYADFSGKTKTGTIEVHKAVSEDVLKFFLSAKKQRFPIHMVAPASTKPYRWNDEKLMAGNVSSGFNYRLSEARGVVSEHGYGRAFDINPVQNPFIYTKREELITAPRGAVWDVEVPGTLYENHPLVKLMLDLGWTWGGHKTVERDGFVDYQHFEKPA